MDEQVLVFQEELLKQLGEFQGFSTKAEYYLSVILKDENIFFVDRASAETNPTVKQLIPYCVLTQGDSIFCYERTKKGGESRLHNKLSLGVGGHINPPDGYLKDSLNLYWNAMSRELGEELYITGGYHNKIIGMLYDNSNEVGRVHFGIVHKIKLADDASVKIREAHLTGGELRSKLWIQENKERFENWSQLIIEHL